MNSKSISLSVFRRVYFGPCLVAWGIMIFFSSPLILLCWQVFPVFLILVGGVSLWLIRLCYRYWISGASRLNKFLAIYGTWNILMVAPIVLVIGVFGGTSMAVVDGVNSFWLDFSRVLLYAQALILLWIIPAHLMMEKTNKK